MEVVERSRLYILPFPVVQVMSTKEVLWKESEGGGENDEEEEEEEKEEENEEEEEEE